MLAGIIIFVAVAAGLAFGLSWLAHHRKTPDEIDGDPSLRFSSSMRIVGSRAVAPAEPEQVVEVSTPLTRRAELTGLRLHAAAAARRRGGVAAALLAAFVVLLVLSPTAVVPFWSISIPASLLVVFLVVARFSVRTMQQRLDSRAERIQVGFGDEDTSVIDLGRNEESLNISVDLGAPHQAGVLWDPIPVTAPTYVSKPLVPRTVRTIDLSAPVIITTTVVPTADHPDDDVEELQLEESQRSRIHPLHVRAVGE
ncbi:MAG: hypothetical protein ACTHWA_07590 [Arachnia sp.]